MTAVDNTHPIEKVNDPGPIRTRTGAVLDAAGLPFTRPAAVWKTEADRRRELRTADNRKKLHDARRNVRNLNSRLASDKANVRIVTKDMGFIRSSFSRTAWGSRAVVMNTRYDLRQARRDAAAAKREYPVPLWVSAARWHAASAVGALTLSATHGGLWPYAVTAGALALNALGIPLGLRHTPDTGPALDTGNLTPSQEETELLRRLDPTWWKDNADTRGLGDTLTAGPRLTASGIQVKIRLDGTLSVDKLKGMESNLRALLRLREKTRMEIRPGDTGGWARVTLRTRTAGDGISLTGWKPGDPWGVDTVTGDPIPVPLGRRMLVTGTSGSGKSWSTRPVLAEASEYPDHRLVLLDMKRVEARNWEHRARIAVEPDEILTVTDELVAEMQEREKFIPRGEDVVQISPDRPRITVFVDEGGELIAAAKVKSKKDEDGEDGPDYGRIIENLRSLARRARASEILLIWATQKATMSGEGHGIDSQIAAQITYRASLAVSSAGESQVTFGSDAIEQGWHAHKLPMPGFAMLRSSPTAQPHPIKTRAFSPQDVINLPARPVWRRGEKSQELPPLAPGSAPTPDESRSTLILDVVAEAGPLSQTAVAKRTGLPKPSVARELKRMAGKGLVRQAEEGWVAA